MTAVVQQTTQVSKAAANIDVPCPRCGTHATDGEERCSSCGMSLDELDQLLGVLPRLANRIADHGHLLERQAQAEISSTIGWMETKFPQCTFQVVTVRTRKDQPSALFAFWLFNRAKIYPAHSELGANFSVLLLVDPVKREAVLTMGHGLARIFAPEEPSAILAAGEEALRSGNYDSAIRTFLRELAAVLKSAARRAEGGVVL